MLLMPSEIFLYILFTSIFWLYSYYMKVRFVKYVGVWYITQCVCLDVARSK